MNNVIIDEVADTIMKSVDFEEDSLYLTICGQVRYNVYEGEDYRDEKKSASDAATPEAQDVESCANTKPHFNYIKKMFGCQGVIS